MSGQGKNKLIAYIEHTKQRLSKLSEGDEPVEDEQLKTIFSSVVNSIKRLSAAAPAELRTQLKEALQSNGCLDAEGGITTDSGIPALEAGLGAALEVLGAPQEDHSDDPPRPFVPHEEEEKPRPVVDIEPGDETETLVGVVNRLWEIEEPYRLKVGTDIELSVQHQADFDPLSADGRTVTDRATEPLFAKVDRSKFGRLDRAFMALLDNYERESDKRESLNAEERAEMDKFLDLLDDSPHMRYVHKVLVKWDLAPSKLRDWMAQVYDAWFTNYYGGRTSGFEHVFVGEEKVNRETGKSEIIGLHNWIQFAREEARGNMNYLGYAHRGPADGTMITVKFAWVDDDPEIEVKTCSTFLVGSSIAFDFALASLIFFGGKDGDKPWVKFGDRDAAIQLYKVKDRMGEYVRTVYVE